ncbi:hypothetical protein [Bradyrhizobium sp. LMG 9283]|uniref:hypothetical protein n=1 Tax=Bradyrhizobium sp. LMG 9283 TaxID=592064 RepID=UPI00388F7C27
MIRVTITRNGELLDEIIFGDNGAHEGSTSGVYRDIVRDGTDAVLWQQVADVAQIVAARGNLLPLPKQTRAAKQISTTYIPPRGRGQTFRRLLARHCSGRRAIAP